MSEEVKIVKEEKSKKKLQKSEDFVGWKSDDGLLEVVGLLEKSKHSKFKGICYKCSEDKELFPNGYFISQKCTLVDGNKPCGCAFKPKWNKEQYLILARRAAQGRFIVNGFAEEFHGAHTKLNLECLKDGHRWTASINSVINIGSGCQKCAGVYRQTEQEVLKKCQVICKTEGYESLGFPSGYKNSRSLFEYMCPTHGKQNIRYYSFVNDGARCKGCWKDKQKETGNGNGYYPERKKERKRFLVCSRF